MRFSYAIGSLALAARNALAAPQGVTAAIAPQASAPAGCSASHSGQFQITVQNVTSSAKVKRDALECTLTGGVLKDAQGRTGYIASNYQFQFDGPPQAGAIYTTGFSLCSNGTLALGGSAIWYQCLSGGFYNLYDRSWAAQCSPIYIEAIGYSSDAAATQATDGQVTGTTVVTSVSQRTDGQPIATTVVSQRTDGQVIATTATAAPVSQISDGQIQAHTSVAPVSQISDGQIQVHTTAAPVSQISDGQIQAHTSAAPVSQISDGQIQVHTSVTGAPVSQMTDGQVYKPTATSAAPVPVSQISDGQIQASPVSSMKPATSVTGVPVSQISDGQIQATTAKPVVTSSTAVPVSQISDGQIQVVTPTVAAANITSVASSKPSQVTVNAVPSLQVAGGAVFAGLAAVAAALL